MELGYFRIETAEAADKPQGDRTSYTDTAKWMFFDEAVEQVERGKAASIGVLLPQVDIPGYNLITNLVALDADAKNYRDVGSFDIPQHLTQYVDLLDSYSKYSPSLRGQRTLALASVPPQTGNPKRRFGLTEVQLFTEGWVTLTGLIINEYPADLQFRQPQSPSAS